MVDIWFDISNEIPKYNLTWILRDFGQVTHRIL
jgi:hypothetical protein